MATPPTRPTSPTRPTRPTRPDQPDQPETGPTEPITSGDPLEGGPERPREETPPPAAAAAPTADPRRLTRSSSDRVVGGVAGGLGRYFDIDPIIFRIGFVVLTLAGGAGLLGYAAAWLFIPADPVPGVDPGPRNRALTYVGAALLVVAAFAMLGPGLFFIGPPLFFLALIALLGAALWRAAEGRGGDGNLVLRRAGLGVLLLVVAGVGFVAVGGRLGRRWRGGVRRPRDRDRRGADRVGVRRRRRALARAAGAHRRDPARLRRRGRDRRQGRRRRSRLPAHEPRRAQGRLQAWRWVSSGSTCAMSICPPATRR